MGTRNYLLDKAITLLKTIKKAEKTPLVPFFSKEYKHIDNVFFGDFTYGNPTIFYWGESTKLVVGKFCSIAGEVKIYLGGNHRIDWISTYPFNSISNFYPESIDIKGHPISKGDVIIGNDVWIGGSSVILSGVKISDGAVIGANSVVTKNIGPYEIYAGNPAKFIRRRFTDLEISKLIEMNWWDWELEHIKKNVEILCSDNINNLYEYYLRNIKDNSKT